MPGASGCGSGRRFPWQIRFAAVVSLQGPVAAVTVATLSRADRIDVNACRLDARQKAFRVRHIDRSTTALSAARGMPLGAWAFPQPAWTWPVAAFQGGRNDWDRRLKHLFNRPVTASPPRMIDQLDGSRLRCRRPRARLVGDGENLRYAPWPSSWLHHGGAVLAGGEKPSILSQALNGLRRCRFVPQPCWGQRRKLV